MRWIWRLGLLAVALYAAVLLTIYWQQRGLLYPASDRRATAAEAGLQDFYDITLATSDGERIVAWYKAPRPGRPIVLYFHGNGGALWGRRDRAGLLTEDGTGLLMVSYRGYSGSTGSPSEEGLATDARAAYDWLSTRFPPGRIVLYGESLGSGVAVRLATERPVGGVILDGPFTSAADVAQLVYPYLPVGLLMKDQFRSLDRIDRLRAPLLVLHGDRDRVIPFALGERLFAAAPEPKRFVRIAGGNHVDNLENGGLTAVREFLDQVASRMPAPPPEAPAPAPSGSGTGPNTAAPPNRSGSPQPEPSSQEPDATTASPSSNPAASAPGSAEGETAPPPSPPQEGGAGAARP